MQSVSSSTSQNTGRPPVAMPGVEAARHDDGGAENGPGVGEIAEHEQAKQRRPDQQGVGIGLHRARLGIIERLDERVVRQRIE